jgi:subtilase family serine protease
LASLLVPVLDALPAGAAADAFLGKAPPNQSVKFLVKLPLRNATELDQLISEQGDIHSPLYHHFLTPKQFASEFGPTAASRARVEAAMKAAGFAIDRAGSQAYQVHAPSATVERAFAVRMSLLRSSNGYVSAVTKQALTLPPGLGREGASVVGIGYVRPKQLFMRLSRIRPSNRYSAVGPYWFTDLKQAYSYPSWSEVRGRNANIGIEMSSDVLDSDTKGYFDSEDYTAISHAPVPTVVRHYVFGGAPFDPNSDASFEASLDVQQSLGSAPGAIAHLYDIPDLSDNSIIAGYFQIVEDDIVDVTSSSFGGCELAYTPAYNGGVDYRYILTIYHDIFAQGNVEGQTFLASSGDSSGLACPTPSYYVNGENGQFVPSIDDPADDPNVTAVGGTNLITTTPPNPQPNPPVLTSKYVRESEFGDPEIPYDVYGYGNGSVVTGGYWGSGSGRSQIFSMPSYQKRYGLSGSGRSIPDVSMQMGGCPAGIAASCGADDSASILAFDGYLYGVIGTSASSPEFAGVLALLVAHGGSRLGNVNTTLYELGAANDALPYHFFHDGIPGYNGVVTEKAGKKGYSQITGLGTPYVDNLVGATNLPVAGNPQTPSNP